MHTLSTRVALAVAFAGTVLWALMLASGAPAPAVVAFPVIVATAVVLARWSGGLAEREFSLLRDYLRAQSGRATEKRVRPSGLTRELGVAAEALLDRIDAADSAGSEAQRSIDEARAHDKEFLRLLSHELRTPLNTILGFSQVLLDDVDGPLTADQRTDLQSIRSAGEHLQELADEVIELASLQSGQTTLHWSEVSAREVLSDVARILEGQARAKGLAVRVADAGDWTLRADAKRLRQIVVNLGSNAVKFTEAGEVTLAATRTGDAVKFTVTDTGPGISTADQALLFETFVQVGPRSQRLKGSGLGLAICKHLVTLHGGSIGVTSILGRGSTFAFDLPLRGPS